MLYRRICYGLALVAALLFQIFYTGHLGTYALVLVVAFPFLSLLVSLPTMLGVRLTLTPEQPTVHRGDEGIFSLTLRNRTGLPLARLTARLRFENLLTGDLLRTRREFRGASRGEGRREDITAHHCGLLRCSAERLRVCDLLGLFALPIAPPPPADLLVLPQPVELEPPTELTGGRGDGAGLRPRPGGGPGEDYDLRPYRAGDPLRAVHWKLSSKLDDLVVRETLEPRHASVVLTFDHFGDPAETDGILDRLYTLSLWLLKKERPHHIQWADPVSGTVQGGPVSDERMLCLRLAEAFSRPLPKVGKSILDCPIRVSGEGGPVRHLHITTGEVGAP